MPQVSMFCKHFVCVNVLVFCDLSFFSYYFVFVISVLVVSGFNPRNRMLDDYFISSRELTFLLMFKLFFIRVQIGYTLYISVKSLDFDKHCLFGYCRKVFYCPQTKEWHFCFLLFIQHFQYNKALLILAQLKTKKYLFLVLNN